MPLFGKSKTKNPPPPPPKPDYTPQNVDPDENPLYQPPELLQSYLEPPVTLQPKQQQQQNLRHSASDIHAGSSTSNNRSPLAPHQLASSESCSFIQNNLSYEVDGNLVKQLKNSAGYGSGDIVAAAASKARPR